MVVVDITNKCNIKCRHCIRSSYKNTINMNFKNFQTLMEDLIKIDDVKVIAIQGGEPLLYTKFFDLMEEIKKRNIKVNEGEYKQKLKEIIEAKKRGNELLTRLQDLNLILNNKRFVITTNCTVYSELILEKMFKSKIYLEVSIDGATEETFERRRVGAKFNRVLKNLDKFVKYLPTEIICAVYTDNITELKQLLFLAIEHKCQAIRFTPVRFPTRAMNENKEFYKRYLKEVSNLIRVIEKEKLSILLKLVLPKNLISQKQDLIELSNPPPNVYYKFGCNAFKSIDSVYIQPNLNAYVCCHIPPKGFIGNLKRLRLEAAWRARCGSFYDSYCDITKNLSRI